MKKNLTKGIQSLLTLNLQGAKEINATPFVPNYLSVLIGTQILSNL